MKESPIFTRTYDLLRWLIPLTVKFPRTQRFVLATRLQETVLRFQERLIVGLGRHRPGQAAALYAALPGFRVDQVQPVRARTAHGK